MRGPDRSPLFEMRRTIAFAQRRDKAIEQIHILAQARPTLRIVKRIVKGRVDAGKM